ncbi:MAG: SUMF1/EgtB/PvdO family nonheme iron enzyme [Pseudomonadota bacterium]
MAAGDKIVIPAQAGGFASLFGQISKGAGDTLSLPEGMINIGGNGKGYLLQAQTDWDPFSAANRDDSFSVLTLGDDIYIYACQQASGIAKWIASKNSTYPTGYSASNSRKVGGFHVGRYRGVANRYSTAYAPVTQILPNSCWDLQHRPTCDPTGMVEVIPGSLWVDIYLNSEGSGTWPENVPVSIYGATAIRDNIYARSDFHQLAGNAGKRLPTAEEFLRYAEGAPAGLDANNDQAWAATGNTGPATTGAVSKAVSQYNVVDAVGNLWDWLDNHHDLGGTFVWSNAVVNVGKDSANPRGYVSHADWRAFIGGGTFAGGVHAGARCLNSNAPPWYADGDVGLRCVCDAL